ncbi:MAG: zf-HC2 domain-containing protein [Planctomycetaceae bacterium]|nr:zf-HC2 domain-containing protein [Planctomycetaceae bacterium]
MTGDYMVQDDITHADSDDWRPCQPGEIASVVRQIAARKQALRRRKLWQISATCAGVLLMVGLVWQISSRPEPKRLAGLTCRQVLERDEQYVRRELEPELQARIKAHLEACPHCQQHMDSVSQRLRQTLISSREDWRGLSDASLLTRADW